MSNTALFSLYEDKKPDYPTQVVIEHLFAKEEAKKDFRQFVGHFWSIVERTDSLRKYFLTEMLQTLTNNEGSHVDVIKAILTDWAQYGAYTLVEWTEMYTALETNTPLPPHCNDITRAIYRTTQKKGWRNFTGEATTFEEGGQLLCNGAIITFQIWLEYPEYRDSFGFNDANAQIVFHALTYAVNWEKVAIALLEPESGESSS